MKITRDIAVGLSHEHFGRSEENASFVHLDVNPADNIVVVDNTLKLNDFNIGIMLKRNTTSGLPCGFPAQMLASYTLNPDERPSSRDIAKFLDYQFANLSRDAKLKSPQ